MDFSSRRYIILSDSEEILAYFKELLELVMNREKEIANLSSRDDITGNFVNFGKEMKNEVVCYRKVLYYLCYQALQIIR